MPNILSNYIQHRVELLENPSNRLLHHGESSLKRQEFKTYINRERQCSRGPSNTASTVLRKIYILTSPVMYTLVVVFSNLLPCRIKDLRGMAERRTMR